tara:strand:- start:7104 stop:7337 length:234 start_codon:yes stop_codon:yes gene_type:complete
MLNQIQQEFLKRLELGEDFLIIKDVKISTTNGDVSTDYNEEFVSAIGNLKGVLRTGLESKGISRIYLSSEAYSAVFS